MQGDFSLGDQAYLGCFLYIYAYRYAVTTYRAVTATQYGPAPWAPTVLSALKVRGRQKLNMYVVDILVDSGWPITTGPDEQAAAVPLHSATLWMGSNQLSNGRGIALRLLVQSDSLVVTTLSVVDPRIACGLRYRRVSNLESRTAVQVRRSHSTYITMYVHMSVDTIHN